jgi:hypothetical protein
MADIFGENNIFRRLGRNIETQVRTNIAGTSEPFLGGSLGPAEANPFATDPIVNFAKSNSSYSGADCIVIVQLNNKLIVLGNVETFSHSIHREKVPVRTLGRSNPKGFTAGGRTIPLWSIIKEIDYVRLSTDRSTSPLPDQLPPLDLILLFSNEYGHSSIVRLYGVEFLDEGSVYSINDLYSECTMQYVARDMDQMIAYQELAEFRNMMFERQARGQYIDNQYQGMLDYKGKLESQISEANAKIDNIDLELNRRAFANAVTLFAAEGLSKLAYGSEFLTRDQLKSEKSKQLKIKKGLLSELEKINKMISQRELVGTNANRGDETGHMATDNARAAVSTPVPFPSNPTKPAKPKSLKQATKDINKIASAAGLK